MKWAILSDVHGNLEAFEAVLADLAPQKPGKVICLGDIVGYGADPNECIAALTNLTDLTAAGNHDYGAVGMTSIENFNRMAYRAIVWTGKNLTMRSMAYLRSLPFFVEVGQFVFAHAAPHEPGEWRYIASSRDAEESFRELDGRTGFIGHSHVPMVLQRGGPRDRGKAEEMTLEEGASYLINVGSVGQPRDGDPRAAYGIYDDESRVYTVRRVPYDIAAAQKKIRKAGLPPFLAERLAKGR
ncbi:MAG TPA: metallophosphoesterase family protein [Thermodesulfobacteriota bacterium]|nr:metallophosphoesterase family protein [Thermodesulfobacteriota bacterium]